MRYCFLLVLFGCTLLFNTAYSQTIRVAAAHWTEFSEPNGTGIYLEVIKKSLSHEELTYDVGSFARAKRLFKSKKADILVGVYKADTMSLGDVIFPKYYLDLEFPVIAIYNPKVVKLSDDKDFKNLTVAWFEEYAYDKYVPEHGRSYRFNSIGKALQLLENGKVDVIVDHIYNLSNKQKVELANLELTSKQPIFVAFQNNETGQRLRRQFEFGFERLYKNKQLEELFGEHYAHAEFSKMFHKHDASNINQP